MITRKLATLGLGLALVMGIAGANAAQPAMQSPVAGGTASPMQATSGAQPETVTPARPTPAKTVSTKTATDKIGAAKIGTKSGAAKLNSGRSVAAAHKATHRRLHVSAIKAKHRLHVAHKPTRTHVAHVAKKGAAKHA